MFHPCSQKEFTSDATSNEIICDTLIDEFNWTSSARMTKLGVKVDMDVVPNEQGSLWQSTMARLKVPGGKYSLASDLAVHGRFTLGASSLYLLVLGLTVASVIGWIFLYSRITIVHRELEARNVLLESKLRYLLCKHGDISVASEPDCDLIIHDNQPTTTTTDIHQQQHVSVERSKRDLNSLKLDQENLAQLNESPTLSSNTTTTTQSKINDRKNFRRSIRDGGSRAAFLVVNGPEINVLQRGQRLGPWYIAKNGSELGFSDGHEHWYGEHLRLGVNSTSIVFQESGLFLIYAQVYYHVTLEIGERPKAMGFQITVKKNSINDSKIKRPIPIAECVPSHPSTAYQTCFTQAAWYIGKGDEVYLEHFMPGLPMIECDKQGQTFLGIVKL